MGTTLVKAFTLVISSHPLTIDASRLGWKLAYVIHGRAHPSLLKTVRPSAYVYSNPAS